MIGRESDSGASAAAGDVLAVDLSSPLSVHLIGIGGAGMSSIATILLEMGHRVSGSDARESKTVESLRERGAAVFIGHARGQLANADLVVRSTAVSADNPELLDAMENSVPVLNRRSFLPLLAAMTPLVSVSGTHGKTTTSSMTAVVLTSAGLDPSFLIGSHVHSLGSSAGHRPGRLMVLEADESDGSFLAGPRAAAIVTNIEPDHLDYWGSWESLVDGFRRFLVETDGPRVICVDDPTLAALRRDVDAIGYGFDRRADYRIVSYIEPTVSADPTRVGVDTPNGHVEFDLWVPGRYNALNATGALAVAEALGSEQSLVAAGLESYRGVARRFEARGRAAGVDFVDDYAHHPTELRAVIGAATSGRWNRVVGVFQPHRFTRTEALWEDFTRAFDSLDVLVVTDIYPAGERPRSGITGEALAAAIDAAADGVVVEYRSTLSEAAELLAGSVFAGPVSNWPASADVAQLAGPASAPGILREGDLCLSLGAGDVTTIADRVIPMLRGREVDGSGSGSKGP